MSFLRNLSNKKEQSTIVDRSMEHIGLSELQEEYLGDGNLEDTTEESSVTIQLEREEEAIEEEAIEEEVIEKEAIEEEAIEKEAFEKEAFEEDSDFGVEYEIVEREILPAKIICPDCGGITLEGLDFCDKCGGEL